jgi:tripartite-type tricarboxylate transporter receptor subunit TctC
MLFANMPAVIGKVQSGQLKPLAVSTAGRSDALPDVPTMQEAGIDNFEVNPWYGVLAPAGTPKEVIEQLSAELGKALQDPKVRERMASLGAQPIGTTPEEFSEIIAADTAMYAKAVEQSGATMQ